MVNLPRLMDAIAKVESSGGVNNWPRIEPAYMPSGFAMTIQGRVVRGTGTNFNAIVAQRWRDYGPPSAASYSSWQVLYHSAADMGYRGYPTDLWHDSNAKVWVEKKMARLLQKAQAKFSDDLEVVKYVADSWNSGNANDTIVPVDYIDKVLVAYGEV